MLFCWCFCLGYVLDEFASRVCLSYTLSVYFAWSIMQLHRVKISNVLSFPYQPSFASFAGVVFDTGEKAMTNTLIWPNGSGKSNFLDIVSQVFKAGLFVDYIYNADVVSSTTADLTKTITSNAIRLERLDKHFLYPDKKSQVTIEIVFNNNDYDNLFFLCKYRTTINALIKKYSRMRIQFADVPYESLLFYNRLSLDFTIDVQWQKTVLRTRTFSSEQKFLLDYLQHIELIQICMSIYNDYERKEGERKRYPLKNTFALLSSQRTHALSSLVEDVSAMRLDTKAVLLAKDTAKADPTIGYRLCLSKILHQVKYAQEQCAMDMQSCIDDAFAHNGYIAWLNETLLRYLWYTLQAEYADGMFYFWLVDRSRQHYYDFSMLSSGEQSFLLIIMSLYGYDMENGLMIIDEPELHLHPQMQKQFIDMIDEVSEKLKMQFIVATHSPVMINEKNIGHVYKCTKINNGTHIHNPPYKYLWTDEANLIHMLKFGNVAKIFFVDTIIMVEWETDAYFFDYYLQYIRTLVPRWHMIQNYEIININGKWSYRKWEKFLSKFGLHISFLGDRDNVLDRGIVKLQDFTDKMDALRRKQHLRKVQRYGKLVSLIAEDFPDEHAHIDKRIEALYKNSIFILKKGDLETYLGLPIKWLDEVVHFCHNTFARWYADPRYDVFRSELDMIFRFIFAVGD